MEAGHVVQRGDRHSDWQHWSIREGAVCFCSIGVAFRCVLHIMTECVCGSGPRHRGAGRDHLRDVQRGEERFLPLCGFGSEQAALRCLQTSSTNVRQPKPCGEVSQQGRGCRKHVRALFSRFNFLFVLQVHSRRDREAKIVSKASVCLLFVFYLEMYMNILLVFRLREKHGNDWATIGAALGRSASSVKDRCRLMKDTCNTGGDTLQKFWKSTSSSHKEIDSLLTELF